MRHDLRAAVGSEATGPSRLELRRTAAVRTEALTALLAAPVSIDLDEGVLAAGQLAAVSAALDTLDGVVRHIAEDPTGRSAIAEVASFTIGCGPALDVRRVADIVLVATTLAPADPWSTERSFRPKRQSFSPSAGLPVLGPPARAPGPSEALRSGSSFGSDPLAPWARAAAALLL